MDFALSGPEKRLRDEVRCFAEEEVAPQVPSLNEKGELPLALVKRTGQLGLIGLFVPREYGGRDRGQQAILQALRKGEGVPDW